MTTEPSANRRPTLDWLYRGVGEYREALGGAYLTKCRFDVRFPDLDPCEARTLDLLVVHAEWDDDAGKGRLRLDLHLPAAPEIGDLVNRFRKTKRIEVFLQDSQGVSRYRYSAFGCRLVGEHARVSADEDDTGRNYRFVKRFVFEVGRAEEGWIGEAEEGLEP